MTGRAAVGGAPDITGSPVIEGIVPPAVAAAEAFDDLPGLTLCPDEEVLVRRAVDSRRREFTTGRHCARTAVRRLGMQPRPIVGGEHGAPRWPAGVVGSITHCTGYRAAAVARATDVVGIGIDAEPNAPLPDGVLGMVSLPREREHLSALAARAPGIAWDRLLFSAKEAVYKVWSPLTGTFLGFAGADVVFDPAAGTFVAHLLVPAPPVGGRPWRRLTGRCVARDDLVVTTIVLTLTDTGR